MAKFITSDLHLGEERMAILGRPFRDAHECIDAMIRNHNAIVSPDDEVIVAGDVCYQNALNWLPRIAEFNGHKTLVRGNHDRGFTDADLAPYFETVVSDGGGLVVDHGGQRYNITHYPTQGVQNLFNLVGHVHGAWKVQKNMLNVGVDVHHFRPVNMDDIPFWTKAINEFYDEDVWVSYWPVNMVWRDKRGKKGTYFNQKENS